MGSLVQSLKMREVTMNKNTFREKVKAWRKGNGMLQAELADEIGTPRCQIQRWETHVNPPRADWALKIAQRMGTTVEYLIDESIPNAGANVPSPGAPRETEKGKLIAWYVREIGEDEAVRRLMQVANGPSIAKIESTSITDVEYKALGEQEQKKERRKKA